MVRAGPDAASSTCGCARLSWRPRRPQPRESRGRRRRRCSTASCCSTSWATSGSPASWTPPCSAESPARPRARSRRWWSGSWRAAPSRRRWLVWEVRRLEGRGAGSCGWFGGSLWRRGGWRRGCSPCAVIFLLSLLQCLSHVPGRDLCLLGEAQVLMAFPQHSTGCHRCPQYQEIPAPVTMQCSQTAGAEPVH